MNARVLNTTTGVLGNVVHRRSEWTHKNEVEYPGLDGRHIMKSISAKYLMKHDR